MVTFTKERQPTKAESSMRVTEFGIDNVAKELQLAKAKSPMRVTELGMVKLAKELQC